MKTLLQLLLATSTVIFLLLIGCAPSERREVIITSGGKIIDTVHPGQSKEFYLGQSGKEKILSEDTHTAEGEQKAKLIYEELMNCPSCSISYQHIIYLDKGDRQKKETDAYAVLQDGVLFYMTVGEMKVVQMEQIISYTDGVLLRYNGRKPRKGYELTTDEQGNVTTNLNPKEDEEAENLPPVVICNKELESLEKEHSAVYKNLYSSLNSQEQSILKNSQRAWIKVREKKCLDVQEEYAGGSLAGYMYCQCIVEETKNRIQKLKSKTY